MKRWSTALVGHLLGKPRHDLRTQESSSPFHIASFLGHSPFYGHFDGLRLGVSKFSLPALL